jgi:pimeloyl-ACP methyl ester carboxylesterase
LEEFPIELMFRPSQMSAASKDATHMIPDASIMSERYDALSCQLAILAGDGDKVVDPRGHGLRLHQLVPGSYLDVFEQTGHMTHYADPARVVRAIQRVGGAGR